MSAITKYKLKSWMLVYVGFVLALTAANTHIDSRQGAAVISPGTVPSTGLVEQTFFRPTGAKPRRNDI